MTLLHFKYVLRSKISLFATMSMIVLISLIAKEPPLRGGSILQVTLQSLDKHILRVSLDHVW